MTINQLVNKVWKEAPSGCGTGQWLTTLRNRLSAMSLQDKDEIIVEFIRLGRMSWADKVKDEEMRNPVPKRWLVSDLIVSRRAAITGVYFIMSLGRTKIGFAGDVQKRYACMRKMIPEQAVLLGWIQCEGRDAANALEREVHAHFKPNRLHGEWFDLPRETVDAYLEQRGGVREWQ